MLRVFRSLDERLCRDFAYSHAARLRFIDDTRGLYDDLQTSYTNPDRVTIFIKINSQHKIVRKLYE